jgi:DNA-binding CsgD family transcriptional regulator
VVAGAIGVGKSALLDAAVDRLAAAGQATVVVRATRSSASVPFGAFAAWVPIRSGTETDRLGVLQRTAQALAAIGPDPVVVVDDAHALDDGSAALVLHLAQHTPVAVLAAVRTGEACPDGVVALWKEGLAARLTLQPLSEHEAADVARGLVGGPLAPSARRRLWRVTQGNPLWIREVLDAARAQGLLLSDPAGWRWDDALAGGSGLLELVGHRLDAGSPEQRRVLEILAIGEPLPVDVVSALAPRGALVDLEARGLIASESSATATSVRLAHPLYTEALRGDLMPFARRQHFRDLAAAAIATGLQGRDPLRVATWLIDGGVEATEPELFLDAARAAQCVGEPELVVRLAAAAERAGAGAPAMLLQAEAMGPLRRWSEAAELLARLVGPDVEPNVRAAARRVEAAQAFWHRGDDAAVAQGMLRDAHASVPPAAGSTLLMEAARLALTVLDLDEAVRLATEGVAAADTVRDRLEGMACVALAVALRGDAGGAVRLAEAMVPYAARLAASDPGPAIAAASVYMLAAPFAGHIDEAAALFAALADHELVSRYGHMQGLPRYCLARAVLTQGKVATAARLCEEVLGREWDDEPDGSMVWVATLLATAAAQRGDSDTALRALEWIGTGPPVRAETETILVALAHAWSLAARGTLSGARASAEEAAQRAGKAGAGLLEVMALEVLVRLGEPDTAAPRLAELADTLGGRYVEVLAAFALALADGDGVGLDASAEQWATLGARLQAAEAAAAAAEAHDLAGNRRAAATSRSRARRLALDCEDAATPLLASLRHAPSATALTPREREVAELAARGLSNRDIAEMLVVSPRTVDSHLDHAYTKLGITSRRELVAVLGLEIGSGAG